MQATPNPHFSADCSASWKTTTRSSRRQSTWLRSRPELVSEACSGLCPCASEVKMAPGGHRIIQCRIVCRAFLACECAVQKGRAYGDARLSLFDSLDHPARALRSTARFFAPGGAMLQLLVQPLGVLLQDVPGGEPALSSPLMTSACRPTSASTRVVTGSPQQPLEFRTRFRLSARRQIATITPVPINAGPKRTPQWQKAPLHQQHSSEQNLARPKKMLPRKCGL